MKYKLTKNFDTRIIQHPNRLTDLAALIVRQSVRGVRTCHLQHGPTPLAVCSPLDHLGERSRARNRFEIGEVGSGLEIFGLNAEERVVWALGNVVRGVFDIDELLREAILGGGKGGKGKTVGEHSTLVGGTVVVTTAIDVTDVSLRGKRDEL